MTRHIGRTIGHAALFCCHNPSFIHRNSSQVPLLPNYPQLSIPRTLSLLLAPKKSTQGSNRTAPCRPSATNATMNHHAAATAQHLHSYNIQHPSEHNEKANSHNCARDCVAGRGSGQPPNTSAETPHLPACTTPKHHRPGPVWLACSAHASKSPAMGSATLAMRSRMHRISILLGRNGHHQSCMERSSTNQLACVCRSNMVVLLG